MYGRSAFAFDGAYISTRLVTRLPGPIPPNAYTLPPNAAAAMACRPICMGDPAPTSLKHSAHQCRTSFPIFYDICMEDRTWEPKLPHDKTMWLAVPKYCWPKGAYRGTSSHARHRSNLWRRRYLADCCTCRSLPLRTPVQPRSVARDTRSIYLIHAPGAA